MASLNSNVSSDLRRLLIAWNQIGIRFNKLRGIYDKAARQLLQCSLAEWSMQVRIQHEVREEIASLKKNCPGEIEYLKESDLLKSFEVTEQKLAVLSHTLDVTRNKMNVFSQAVSRVQSGRGAYALSSAPLVRFKVENLGYCLVVLLMFSVAGVTVR